MGVLHARLLSPELREAARGEVQCLPQIVPSPLSIGDVELCGNSAYTPLTGFLNKADYESVVDMMHLTNGSVWTRITQIPRICLCFICAISIHLRQKRSPADARCFSRTLLYAQHEQ